MLRWLMLSSCAAQGGWVGGGPWGLTHSPGTHGAPQRPRRSPSPPCSARLQKVLLKLLGEAVDEAPLRLAEDLHLALVRLAHGVAFEPVLVAALLLAHLRRGRGDGQWRAVGSGGGDGRGRRGSGEVWGRRVAAALLPGRTSAAFAGLLTSVGLRWPARHSASSNYTRTNIKGPVFKMMETI